MLPITKDRTEESAGLRVPAAQIEQLVTSRVRQWLLDRGSIYKATSARFPDPSTQRRLAARAAEVGKRWPEFPVTRTRAVLAALIERIEVSVDQIKIRLRPRRLNALLDIAAVPIQGVIDDETEIVSVPVRLRRAGREIRMVIDGTDPFAASKPDARLIKLLLKAAGLTRPSSAATRFPLRRLPSARASARPISRVLSASAISRRISPTRS